MTLDEQLELGILCENLPPPGKKRVVVVVGRFNPPTIGHYKVIEKARTFIKNHPELNLEALPIIFIIGNDAKHDSLIAKIKAAPDKSKVAKEIEELRKNPLSMADRAKFMRSSGHANAAKIMTASNAFEAFETLRKHGMEPIAIAAGSDRADKYIGLLDKYFLDANEQPIKRYVINISRDEGASLTKKAEKATSVADTLNKMRDEKNISVDAVSGSIARAAVDAGYEEEFASIVGLSKNKALAKQMFDKIAAVSKEL